jgi:hypothetical protein
MRSHTIKFDQKKKNISLAFNFYKVYIVSILIEFLVIGFNLRLKSSKMGKLTIFCFKIRLKSLPPGGIK